MKIQSNLEKNVSQKNCSFVHIMENNFSSLRKGMGIGGPKGVCTIIISRMIMTEAVVKFFQCSKNAPFN